MRYGHSFRRLHPHPQLHPALPRAGKTLADCAFEGALARVRLSQEDTLRFPASGGPIRIQLRLRTTAGTALKSGVLTAAPDELLKEGVI